MKTENTNFYSFNQNNSGGLFVTNEDVCEMVYIEAHSAKEANAIAEDIGIYFDGCSDGIDCNCCGDRWYPADEHDIVTEKEAKEYKSMWTKPSAIIHYLDGKKAAIE